MMEDIPFLVDKIEVFDDYRYAYRQNGISFRINFKGLNYEVPDCKIHEGNGSYPVTGNGL